MLNFVVRQRGGESVQVEGGQSTNIRVYLEEFLCLCHLRGRIPYAQCELYVYLAIKILAAVPTSLRSV